MLLCSFCTGFILVLELPGCRDRKRLLQVLLFLVVSLPALVFLYADTLPIANLIGKSLVIHGVVLQTTSSSCSAASIATLARKVKPHLQTTELDVVKLAGTTRHGTNTLGEIHAMRELGLAPQHERNLTIATLVARKQMAVLHVMEPSAGTRILHAIALLQIDPAKRTMTLANPLYGEQVKTFDEMQDYWTGEAVFVTASP